MDINNNSGTVSALNGAINIREAGYNESFNSNMYGGDLLSKEVNAYTGAGTTDIHVKELTGILNTNGSAAHVSADTGTLILGNQCLVDDPTYYNTGNIVIGGNILVGEKLAIVAGGDITAAGGVSNLAITARLAGGNQDGQDITIVAGVNLFNGDTQTSGNLSGNPPPFNSAGGVTLNFGSGTGGNIDLSTVSGTSIIDASAGTSAGNGATSYLLPTMEVAPAQVKGTYCLVAISTSMHPVAET